MTRFPLLAAIVYGAEESICQTFVGGTRFVVPWMVVGAPSVLARGTERWLLTFRAVLPLMLVPTVAAGRMRGLAVLCYMAQT